jgi:LysM repeat protein
MEAQEAIERGVEAARAGNQRTAYYYFNAATRADPTSEQAWLWRASAAPRPEEALNCLAAVLALNPDNPVARHGLEQISAAVAAARDQEPEAITPSRVVREAGFQPPERRLEWQQTFQRDHYDAGRLVHLAAPPAPEPPAAEDGPPVAPQAIVAMLTAPDLPDDAVPAAPANVLRPVGNLVDGVRRSLVERNAQRQRIIVATAIPVVLLIALVIFVAAAQFPAQGAPPPPATPGGALPTATIGSVVPPPPDNPTATSVPIVDTTPPPPPAETDTPAPLPPAETDTPAPPPPAETDTPVPPPPAATDTPAPQGGAQTYTVAPGDTLSTIAAKFGVSLAALMVTNHLTHPFDAKPGQQLTIPPADFHPTELTHRVLPGENLTGIAALYGADPNAIAARNGLTNPNQVFAGQELIIPLP